MNNVYKNKGSIFFFFVVGVLLVIGIVLLIIPKQTKKEWKEGPTALDSPQKKEEGTNVVGLDISSWQAEEIKFIQPGEEETIILHPIYWSDWINVSDSGWEYHLEGDMAEFSYRNGEGFEIKKSPTYLKIPQNIGGIGNKMFRVRGLGALTVMVKK